MIAMPMPMRHCHWASWVGPDWVHGDWWMPLSGGCFCSTTLPAGLGLVAEVESVLAGVAEF